MLGVRGEIQDELLQLRGVALNARRPLGAMDDEFDGRRERRAQKTLRLLQEEREVNDADREIGLARERQDLSYEIPGAKCRRTDVVEVFVKRLRNAFGREA
jgi:hypothetical protein